ncbi:MAG: putative nucleotidyltransferase with HDIG domain [Bacteriovoracaceae bacterium]|jgi:putative nucleotidyltransferase with HDIG domain
MSEVDTRTHIDISLNILKRFNRALSFDIYIQRTETSYTKIFKKGDLIDWDRVALYEDKGITHFYLTAKDYEVYGLFVERLGDQLVGNSKKFSNSEARELLRDLAQFTVHEMIDKLNIDERAIYNATNVVEGCLDILDKDPKGILGIMSMLSNQPYIMKHSVMVSIFSVLLAKAHGINSETNLTVIGLGAFLHDVGVSQLTFDPEDEDQLTPEQRKEMNRHPEVGRQLLDRIRGIRSEVLQIVVQHHEQPNGAGYPNGLRDNDIYPPAKIVSIADTFSSLITKRSYREGFTVSEAINIMRESTGKFDKGLLDQFAQIVLPKKAS